VEDLAVLLQQETSEAVAVELVALDNFVLLQ
jgi:hypothetical protein